MRSSLIKNSLEAVPHDLMTDPADYSVYRSASAIAFQRDYAAVLGYSLANYEGIAIDKIKESEEPVDVVYTLVKSVKRNSYEWMLDTRDQKAIIVLQHGNNGTVSGRIWAETEAIARRWWESFSKLFPDESADLVPDQVPIKFWTISADGPSARTRKVNALNWGEIEQNYHPDTGVQLNKMMGLKPPIDGGKLIIYHGPPGTGKSSVIRSLTQAWFPWCDAAYIVDPERFLGDATYMMDVLLNSYSSDYEWNDFEDEEDEWDKENHNKVLKGADRWRLLIIEDADEFIKQDARDKTGQALSRLLNLGDGLIGAGLNFLTLLTNNVSTGALNDAIAREGRALAKIEFKTFSRDQAREWFRHNANADLGHPERDEWSLAQLYNERREVKQISSEEETVNYGVYL